MTVFSRRDEIRESSVIVIHLSEGFGPQGLVDLADAVELSKPILMVAPIGTPVPKVFDEYRGPKLLVRGNLDNVDRSVALRFLEEGGLTPGQHVELLDRPTDRPTD